MNEWKTDREKIIEILVNADYPLTAREIASRLGISEREVIEDLKHVAKTVKRMGMRLYVMPARCRKCGYEFRGDIKKPSKCPRCKSQWIEPPRFIIK